MPSPNANPVRRNAPGINPRDLSHSLQRLGKMAANDKYHMTFFPGGEVADAISFAGQVRDSDEQSVPGVFAVIVWVATAANGGPAGTQTLGVSLGAVIATLAAGQALLVLTDEQGRFTLDVTVSGAGTRYLSSIVINPTYQTDAVVWA